MAVSNCNIDLIKHSAYRTGLGLHKLLDLSCLAMVIETVCKHKYHVANVVVVTFIRLFTVHLFHAIATHELQIWKRLKVLIHGRN